MSKTGTFSKEGKTERLFSTDTLERCAVFIGGNMKVNYRSYYNGKFNCSSKGKHYKVVKFLLTKKQYEKLWSRDRAYNMKSPTLVRQGNVGNFVYSNCCFMERQDADRIKNCGKRFSIEWRKKLAHSNRATKQGQYKNPQNGYMLTYYPVGKRPSYSTNIHLHRYIMQEHLGRVLSSNEIVHHINGNKLDNKLENLQLMTRSEHSKYHARKRKEFSYGVPEETR